MIRRKVIKKTKLEQNNKNKKEEKEKEVILQFNYLKKCIHNLNNNSNNLKKNNNTSSPTNSSSFINKEECILCKLIKNETLKWLNNENIIKNKLKKENFYKRSEMRYKLLLEWSKNQLLLYSDILLLPIGEIILCSSIVESLLICSNLQNDLNNLEKNLIKRNKILEIGKYSAIYLQCRIRGLCCRKRITQFLLRRFEYHEETVRKPAYFLDKNNGNRFYKTPYLISHERPGSPRTIQRRIKFQNDIKEKRMEKYREVCKKLEYKKENDVNEGEFWSSVERGIVSARQMILLRDVLFCLFKELSNKRRENGEKPTSIIIVSNNNSNNNNSNNSNNQQQQNDGNQKTETTFSYWFTMSNPAPPARQLYLSLALDTDPLPEEEIIPPIPLNNNNNSSNDNDEEGYSSQENNSKQGNKISQNKRVSINSVTLVTTTTSSSPSELSLNQQEQVQMLPLESTFDLNDRLQQLDNRIWKMMQCNSADEMIVKLIQCEEIGPAMSSCQQIAEDEHQIWKNEIPIFNNDNVNNNNNNNSNNNNNFKENENLKVDYEEKEEKTEEDIRDLAVMGQYRRTISKAPTKSFSRELSTQFSSVDESEQKEPEKTFIAPNLEHGLYIPCQLQIHPFYPNRQPSGIFRLFFIDGVLAAMTPSSTWVFYPDIWKNRVNIIKSVCDYVETKPIKNLIRTYMSRANDNSSNNTNNNTKKETNQSSSTTTATTSSSKTSSTNLNSNSNNSNNDSNNQVIKAKDNAPMPPKQYDPNYRGNVMSVSMTSPSSASSSVNSQITPSFETTSTSNSNVISVVLPDEKTIFGNYPSFDSAQLTGSEYRTIDQKYKFIRKMKAWKDAKRQTVSEPKIDTGPQLERSLTVSNMNIPPPGKLTQVPPAETLLGSNIFKLSCVDAPKSSLSYQTKYHLANLGGGVAYRSLLKRSVNEIDTTMETKIFPPTGNEFTKNIETPIPPPLARNLIVIDVHITIPPDEPQVNLQNEPKKNSSNDRRMSRRQSNLPPNINANINLTKNQSKTKYIVEAHQVIGIFSAGSEKQPASLDTGLFTWQQITKMATKVSNLRDIMKSPMTPLTGGGLGDLDMESRSLADLSHPTIVTNNTLSTTSLPTTSTSTSISTSNRPILPSIPSTPSPFTTQLPSSPYIAVDMSLTHTIKLPIPMTDDTVAWSLIIPQSGIYGTKVSLGGGLNLEVRLIGRIPDREYLEKTIPKKIRKWVGLRC